MENKQVYQFFGNDHIQMTENFHYQYPAPYPHYPPYFQSTQQYPVNQYPYYNQQPQTMPGPHPHFEYPLIAAGQYPLDQAPFHQFHPMSQQQFDHHLFHASLEMPYATPEDMPTPMTRSVSHHQPIAEVQDREMRIWLKDEDIWHQLASVEGGNEMISKISGRDFFPRLEFLVEGLKASGLYMFGVKLRRINTHINKYNQKDGWHEGELLTEEYPMESNEVFNEVLSGRELMRHGISFKRTKLYNLPTKDQVEKKEEKVDKASKSDSKKRKTTGPATEAKRPKPTVDAENWLQACTQCQYVPILTVYEMHSDRQTLMGRLADFTFHIAKFHVVTEYKSKELKGLKIALNKHVRDDTKAMVLMEKNQPSVSSDSGVSSVGNSTMSSSF